MKRIVSLAPALVLVALPFVSVQACGPDFFPDVFVRSLRPDHPADYAAGKLGVLLPTYPRADLTVAYRYLIGGKLTAEEQRAYQPTLSLAEQVREFDAEDAAEAQSAAAGRPQSSQPPSPAGEWLKGRNRYAPAQPEIHEVRQYGAVVAAGFILAGNYENCQADGFRTATATLESRAETWGAHSAVLADWIRAQDAVFSNCGGARNGFLLPANKPDIHSFMPAAVPADAPALLRLDRAYQLAAARFYAAQFPAARAAFQAIAHDPASPWRGVARYLVARTLIREAYLKAPSGPDDSMASFDRDLMKQAQRELESMRGEPLPGVSPHAVEAMLHLVRLRTEPEARLRELSTALAGPQTDPDYKQDLEDLAWYLNGKLDEVPVRVDADDGDFHVARAQDDYSPLKPGQKHPGFERTYIALADLRAVSPLVDWLITVQSPSEAAQSHALAEWKRTASLPWLVASLLKASAADLSVPVLLEASAHISADSPAWATVHYHRLRLLIDSGRAAEARAELDADLPRIQAAGSDSAINLFTGLRMRAAASFDDALKSAPRAILVRTSEEQASLDECLYVMKNPKRSYDCKKHSGPVEFSADAAAMFNREMPLSVLAQSAQSSALPPDLRQPVAIVAWVRAVLLKNQAIAAQVFPLLPEKVRQQAGPGVGFHPLMTILRNPGLRPYLDTGVQRSYSYDFVESYADNWWSKDWTAGYRDTAAPVTAQSVSFLSPQMRQTGEKEVQALLALGGAEEYLGAQVVDYAHAHPSDPDVPEALYLTLRLIRYGSYHGWDESTANGQKDPVRAVALEVGALMRRRYPTNPWTKKAAPYVWPANKSD